MPTEKTTFKQDNATWRIIITKRKNQDTIQFIYIPKRDPAGCRCILFAQTIKTLAFDEGGKKITTDFEKMLANPKENPSKHTKDDRIKDKHKDFVVIDHVACETDPYYNGNDACQDGGSKGNAANGWFGRAIMSDSPNIPFKKVKKGIARIEYLFETCAICGDTCEVLGCVRWKAVGTAKDPGHITLISKKVEKPSNAFNQALAAFLRNHTRKIKGTDEFRWFCPDRVKEDVKSEGKQPDSFGEIVPAGVRKKIKGTPKEVAYDGVGRRTETKQKIELKTPKGLKKKSITSVNEDALDDMKKGLPHGAIKFTWSGFQSKDVPSVLLTPMTGIALSDIAPFVPRRNPDFQNDRNGVLIQEINVALMRSLLNCLTGFCTTLERSDGPVQLVFLTSIGMRHSAAYLGRLPASSLADVLKQIDRNATDDATLGILKYLDLNYALRITD